MMTTCFLLHDRNQPVQGTTIPNPTITQLACHTNLSRGSRGWQPERLGQLKVRVVDLHSAALVKTPTPPIRKVSIFSLCICSSMYCVGLSWSVYHQVMAMNGPTTFHSLQLSIVVRHKKSALIEDKSIRILRAFPRYPAQRQNKDWEQHTRTAADKLRVMVKDTSF